MIAIGMLKNKPGVYSFEIEKPRISGPKDVLVRIIQAGICGTDRTMIRDDRKDIAPGEERLVLGHEAVGIVEEAGAGVKKLKPGDYVIPTVRRGCGHCVSCANNQSDMCETGLFTERGIHKAGGFFTEYIVDDEKYLVPIPEEIKDLGVLVEPLSIGVKAMKLVELIQSRYPWAWGEPRPGSWFGACVPQKGKPPEEGEWGYCKTALVFGAGPIGFLATSILRLGGVLTYVLENRDEDQPRVMLLKKLGAKYIDSRKILPEEVSKMTGPIDMIIEATGVSGYALRLISALGRNGIYIFTGIPPAKSSEVVLDGNQLLRQTVRMNQVIVGSVNSNRSHFEEAVSLLSKMRKKYPDVINNVITRRVDIRDFDTARKCLTEKDREQIKEAIDIK